MRKLTIALALTAALQIGGLVADGRLISAPLPGGPEVSATLNTADTAYALRHRQAKSA